MKFNEIEKQCKNHEIRARALLGLPLTKRERAMFLLFIATLEEAKIFLKLEKSK